MLLCSHLNLCSGLKRNYSVARAHICRFPCRSQSPPKKALHFLFRERLTSLILFSTFFLSDVSPHAPVWYDVYLLSSYRGRSRWQVSISYFYYIHESARLSIPFLLLPRKYGLFPSLKGGADAFVPGRMTSVRSLFATAGCLLRRGTPHPRVR